MLHKNISYGLTAVIFSFIFISCKKEISQPVPVPEQTKTLGLNFGNVWTSLPAPTITGMPTSDLYNFSFNANDKLYVAVRGYNQLWQYDPATALWTLKQNNFFNFPTSGFGYVFTNGSIAYFMNASTKALKAYDIQANTWTSKANFPGSAAYGYCYTSAAGKGWIFAGGNGYDNNGYGYALSETWQYDFASNAWTQKTSTPGLARYNAAAIAIGDKIYFGTGISIRFIINPITFQVTRTPILDADWWEYNTAGNSWTQKAAYGGGVRQDTRGFVVNSDVYLGMGSAGYFTDLRADFWSYDPAGNTWTQRASYPPGNGYPPYITMTGVANHGYAITETISSFWRYTGPYILLPTVQLGSN